MRNFDLEVIFPDNGMRSLADKSWKLTFETQELSPEDVAELARFKGEYLRLYLVTGELEKELTPPEPPDLPKGKKTPSQRLREILYVYWNEQTNKKMEFNEFYEKYINQLIERIKEKLAP